MHLSLFRLMLQMTMLLDQIITRKEFVNEYQRFLKCSLVGQIQQHLQHYMNDQKGCSSVVPLLTCTAIFSGKLCWTSLDQPEAFSVLSCYHLVTAATAIDNVANNAAAMHLQVSEGVGLNDNNVCKATKLVLLASNSINVLAKQVGVFLVMCTALFQDQSNIVKELQAILAHLLQHKSLYQNMQKGDCFFAAKFTCLIDHKVQLYLGDCLGPTMHDNVSVMSLSFNDIQHKILEGTFELKLLPAVSH